jgi:C-terminal processing protease CtpA/Prc
MKNSPAERAGLKPGDIIVSIGNNFTGNIQTYKTILQNIGEKVPIIVRRDTKLIEVSIKVQSIF